MIDQPNRRRFLQAGLAPIAIAAIAHGDDKTPINVEELTIADAQAGMTAGKFTSHALTAAYLNRIATIDRAGPSLRSVIETNPEALAIAASTGAKRLHLAMRPKRKGSYKTRRPGYDTPMWNVCVTLLAAELRIRGRKVRLALYLGIPRQRLHDFLRGRSRQPDAELLLRMLHWMAEKRTGRDLSL